MCCKIELAISKGADCFDIVAGFKDLRIASLCSVESYTKAGVGTATVIDDVVMANTEKFQKIDVERNTLKHDFDHKAEGGKRNKIYSESVEGMIDSRGPAVMEALDSYLSKEVVIIGREKGEGGKWKAIGMAGGLFVSQVQGSTGAAKADEVSTLFKAEGDVDERWLYIFDTDEATTTTLVNGITA